MQLKLNIVECTINIGRMHCVFLQLGMICAVTKHVQ